MEFQWTLNPLIKVLNFGPEPHLFYPDRVLGQNESRDWGRGQSRALRKKADRGRVVPAVVNTGEILGRCGSRGRGRVLVY